MQFCYADLEQQIINHAKFEGLLSICNVELYKRLSIFIRKAAALL
jgi:hypothetical protein